MVPSTIGPTDWRSLTFQINDQVPTDTNVGNVTAQAMEDAALIGLPQVQANYPYTGKGYTVAVIDTGIDYNNPYLGGGWGNRVIGGWNFVSNNGNPMDDNGHGTFVSGIIGSSNATYTGIAPNVNFVALKVLDSTGSGTFGNVDLALQWVAQHQAQYNIVAVNMSLGAGNYTSNPFTFLESDFQNLTKQGVFISVAAGNSFYSYGSQQGLAYPAVSTSVVSVGATWDGNYGSVTWVNGARDYTTAPGLITSFTQRDSSLSILAPGAMITSETLNNKFATEAGTSMSTPVVTGAAVLLHQALDAVGEHNLTDQGDILSIMQSTGTTVVDNNPAHDNVVNTGLTFKELNLYAALQHVSQTAHSPTQPPVLGSMANQAMQAGQSITITLPGSSPDGLPLTYTAQAVGLASQAYQLRQQLGLTYAGSYFFNCWGAQEKWLIGTDSTWYCLTPDGALRRWSGTIQATLQPSAVVASLGAAYYSDPSLLWNAAAGGSVPVTLTVNGNQLTITAPANYLGTFQVNVTVSDGHNTASGSFQVSVAAAPAIPFPTSASFSSGAGGGTITLPAVDGAGQSYGYSATLGGYSALAAQYQKSLGLFYLGSYFTNLMGQKEEWLAGSGGKLYFLLPSGGLYNFTGSMTAASLVVTLDPAVYSNPQLLLQPVQPTFSSAGNQLTVQYPKGFVGSFVVQVTVTDGSSVTTRFITVTVSNQTGGSSSLGGQSEEAVDSPEPVSFGPGESTDSATPASEGTFTGTLCQASSQTSTLHTDNVQETGCGSDMDGNLLKGKTAQVTASYQTEADDFTQTDAASEAVGAWLADNPV